MSNLHIQQVPCQFPIRPSNHTNGLPSGSCTSRPRYSPGEFLLVDWQENDAEYIVRQQRAICLAENLNNSEHDSIHLSGKSQHLCLAPHCQGNSCIPGRQWHRDVLCNFIPFHTLYDWCMTLHDIGVP